MTGEFKRRTGVFAASKGRRGRRPLTIESLETRQLMAADAVTSFADDRLEPNDSVFFATNLPAQDWIVGNLNLTAGDRDVFSWIAPVDGPVDIKVEFQHALGDIDLEVKNDATGAVYSSMGTRDNELVSLPALRGQWFTITVYGYHGASNPMYHLVVRPLDPTNPGAVHHIPADPFELNDTMQSATRLAPGDVALTDLTLEYFHGVTGDPLIDNDWYRWTPRANGQTTIDLRFLHRALDANLEVYDQTGMLIAGAYSKDDDEQLQFASLAGQSYFVRVFSVWEGLLFDYDLSIDGPEILADRFEPNDGLKGAARLGTGDQTRTGLTVHAANNHDWFVWTAPASGTLDVDVGFSHAAGNLSLRVYDDAPVPRQLAVSRTNADHERATIAVVAGRRYYIRVYGEGGALSPGYSLALNGPEPPASTSATQAADVLFDSLAKDDFLLASRVVRRQAVRR